jgi:hypothetical protein
MYLCLQIIALSPAKSIPNNKTISSTGSVGRTPNYNLSWNKVWFWINVIEWNTMKTSAYTLRQHICTSRSIPWTSLWKKRRLYYRMVPYKHVLLHQKTMFLADVNDHLLDNDGDMSRYFIDKEHKHCLGEKVITDISYCWLKNKTITDGPLVLDCFKMGCLVLRQCLCSLSMK